MNKNRKTIMCVCYFCSCSATTLAIQTIDLATIRALRDRATMKYSNMRDNFENNF